MLSAAPLVNAIHSKFLRNENAAVRKGTMAASQHGLQSSFSV
jgi:hypothetical protein